MLQGKIRQLQHAMRVMIRMSELIAKIITLYQSGNIFSLFSFLFSSSSNVFTIDILSS